MERELRQALAERDEYRRLAAALADRLMLAQRENEAAYIEAYESHQGPHFCVALPFGSDPKAVMS